MPRKSIENIESISYEILRDTEMGSLLVVELPMNLMNCVSNYFCDTRNGSVMGSCNIGVIILELTEKLEKLLNDDIEDAISYIHSKYNDLDFLYYLSPAGLCEYMRMGISSVYASENQFFNSSLAYFDTVMRLKSGNFQDLVCFKGMTEIFGLVEEKSLIMNAGISILDSFMHEFSDNDLLYYINPKDGEYPFYPVKFLLRVDLDRMCWVKRLSKHEKANIYIDESRKHVENLLEDYFAFKKNMGDFTKEEKKELLDLICEGYVFGIRYGFNKFNKGYIFEDGESREENMLDDCSFCYIASDEDWLNILSLYKRLSLCGLLGLEIACLFYVLGYDISEIENVLCDKEMELKLGKREGLKKKFEPYGHYIENVGAVELVLQDELSCQVGGIGLQLICPSLRMYENGDCEDLFTDGLVGLRINDLDRLGGACLLKREIFEDYGRHGAVYVNYGDMGNYIYYVRDRFTSEWSRKEVCNVINSAKFLKTYYIKVPSWLKGEDGRYIKIMLKVSSEVIALRIM